MSTIEIKFVNSEETQKIFIPETSGKSRIHLIFAKNSSGGPAQNTEKKSSSEHIETVIIDDKVWYSCKICELRFRIWRVARNHVANCHLREKNFLCVICGKSFIDPSSYGAHMKSHEDRPHQCINCPRRFATAEELKIHDDGQHAGRERKYQCGNCNKMFMQISHLKQHVLTHADEKPFRCRFCNRGYARADTCANHEKSHENDKIYTCETCSRTFQSVHHLKRHVKCKHSKCNDQKTESAEKQEKCETEANLTTKSTKNDEISTAVASIADDTKGAEKVEGIEGNIDKDTETKQDPGEVKQSVESEMDEKIDVDGKEKVGNVDGDNTAVTGDDSARKKQVSLFRPRHQYVCDLCCKVFKKKDSLQNHINIHTGEKPFECDICHDKFRQKHHLQRHMLKHNGEKKITCEVCGKAFSRLEHLKQHFVRKHSVEGKASLMKECPLCEKKIQNLKKHIQQVHSSAYSDKQTNQCSICHEVFRSLNRFNRHIMNGKHIKEDDVDRTCPICLQQFNKKPGSYAVKRHMINVHGKDGQVEPLMCSACHRKFIDQASFSQHSCKGHAETKQAPKRQRSATVTKPPKKSKRQKYVESSEESDSGEEIEIEHDGFDVIDFM